MNIRKTIFVVFVLALVALLITGCVGGGSNETKSADTLFSQANAKATEAEKIRNDNESQVAKFKDAIALYQRAINKANTDPKKPVIAVEAMLNMGKVQAGIPIESTITEEGRLDQKFRNTIQTTTFFVIPKEAKFQDDYKARETFKSIANVPVAKKPFSQLVNDYGRSDTLKIRSAIEQADLYQDKIFEAADQKARGDFRYKFMAFLVSATGGIKWLSYWMAMVLLAVIVKIVITPLTKAQFKSMKEMQKIQPLMKELQEKYKDDQQELGRRMMALYKEHGVNPVAGCLPLIIQIPVLIGVYGMIRLFEYQFTKGTFLWIGWGPLVHKTSFSGFGGHAPIWITAANLAQPDLILLILYTVSLIISQKISIVDPTQAEQQKMMMWMMPIMFFFLLGSLPSAFIFYWFVFNLLQTWQQYHILHGGQTAAVEAPATTSQTPPSTPRRRRRR